ncbi:MAG: hypothetical protein H0X14_11365 [Acidobacteria bacterium]|nr:hypothetical protein [Acidobacteriota bacterium]
MPKKRPPSASSKPASTRTAEEVARTSFRSDSDPASLRRDVWRWLMGVVWSVVLIPTLFYLRFGEVGALGWGTTVFFAAYCLLAAVGLHFLVRPEYHTPVALRNDWMDRVGMFWLVACAFGPLFGWALAATFELSAENWRWFYWGRVGDDAGFAFGADERLGGAGVRAGPCRRRLHVSAAHKAGVCQALIRHNYFPVTTTRMTICFKGSDEPPRELIVPLSLPG